MQVKKFYATSLPAAMRDIRRALGGDAVILSTRTLPENTGILLTDGRATVEVTAARETPEPMPAAVFPKREAVASLQRAAREIGREHGRNAEPRTAPRDLRPNAPEPRPASRAAAETRQAPARNLEDLFREIKALKGLLATEDKDSSRTSTAVSEPAPPSEGPRRFEDLDSPQVQPAAWATSVVGVETAVDLIDAPWVEREELTTETILPARLVQKRLSDQGVEAALTKRILERMHFGRDAVDGASESRGSYGRFLQVVEGFLPPPLKVGDSASPRMTALIGPTGVGKTTTVAKIASRLALEQDKRVALVTLDTYRIAAAEQLKTYARLLGVPLEVVNEPRNLQASLSKFYDFDEILIDTPGYSPKDSKALRELSEAFAANPEIEIHLLMTSSTRGGEMRRIMERFQPIGFDRIIFSKTDEATVWGDLLNTWIMGGYAVSFFTTGQRVPEDLEEASIGSLCRKLLSVVEE